MMIGSVSVSDDAACAALDAAVLHFQEIDASALDAIALRRNAETGVLAIVVETVSVRGARAAFDAGADAVVAADDIDELPAVVRAASAGYLCFPAELRAAFSLPALSRREKQILGLVVLGLSNKEIASTLYVTQSTVKSHLSSAFAKLGVSSRSEATALILDSENGLGKGILAITDGD
jgi:DNA-binding NarL/FixJ family response regulator